MGSFLDEVKDRTTNYLDNLKTQSNSIIIKYVSKKTIIGLLKNETIENKKHFVEEKSVLVETRLKDNLSQDELHNYKKIFKGVIDLNSLIKSLKSGRSYGTRTNRKSNRDNIKNILLEFLNSSNNDKKNIIDKLRHYVKNDILREAYVERTTFYKHGNHGGGTYYKKKKTRRKKLKKTKRNRKKYTKKFTKKRKH